MANELREEVVEAMAQGIHTARIAPHETPWAEMDERYRDCCRFDAAGALTALLALLDERGLAIVPKVATIEMRGFGQDADFEDLGAVYAAMLSAAPSPLTEAGDVT